MIAVATADLTPLGVDDEDLDAPLLQAAVEDRAGPGVLRFARWDDPGVDWAAFDLVVLRSTWDYARRLPEFLDWLGTTSAVTRVLNDPRVVEWNSDKRYLGDLDRAGVDVVPTAYATDPDGVRAAFAGLVGQVVVKPAVSAGSHLTGRFRVGDPAGAALAGRILAAGKTVMVQPFVPSVAVRGETAVIFLDGRASHAVRKGPLLAEGGGLIGGAYVEELTPVELDARHRTAAQRALDAFGDLLPDVPPLLYARVDLVEDEEGTLRLLELELIEPSLFLPQAPGSAGLLADAVLGRAG